MKHPAVLQDQACETCWDEFLKEYEDTGMVHGAAARDLVGQDVWAARALVGQDVWAPWSICLRGKVPNVSRDLLELTK